MTPMNPASTIIGPLRSPLPLSPADVDVAAGAGAVLLDSGTKVVFKVTEVTKPDVDEEFKLADEGDGDSVIVLETTLIVEEATASAADDVLGGGGALKLNDQIDD